MRDVKIGLIGAGWMGKVHSMSCPSSEHLAQYAA